MCLNLGSRASTASMRFKPPVPQVGEKIAHRSEPVPDVPINGERPEILNN